MSEIHNLTVRLQDEAWQLLKRLAKAEHRSLNSQVVYLITKEADRLESWTVTGPSQKGHASDYQHD